MSANKLQTALLGVKVKLLVDMQLLTTDEINEVCRKRQHRVSEDIVRAEWPTLEARIANVYLADGEPQYTLVIVKTGEVKEAHRSMFVVVDTEELGR